MADGRRRHELRSDSTDTGFALGAPPRTYVSASRADDRTGRAALAVTLLSLVVVLSDALQIERPLAIVMIGGLVTSTLFTLLALPTFYLFVHDLSGRWGSRKTIGTVWVTHVMKRLRLRRPDFSTVLVVIVALAIFLLMTFELWVSHGLGH